ncbi:MAG: sugar transferase [Chloroflexota bacterium]
MGTHGPPSLMAGGSGAAAKRAFDAVVAALGLAVLSPFLVVTGLAVRLDSPGPAVYRARRTGLHGAEFQMLKFRTMRADASTAGPRITTGGDSRVTRVGRLLRGARLDELPQLWNVLRGDMSLVGPRPEDPYYVARYTPEQRRVLSVRPGITSAAALYFHDESRLLTGPDWEQVYLTEVMPGKIVMDLEYVDRWSFGSDLRILWLTLRHAIGA